SSSVLRCGCLSPPVTSVRPGCGSPSCPALSSGLLRHGVRGRGATRTACPASGAHADRLRAAGREGDGGEIEFVAAVDGAPELDAMSMAIETELRGEQCRCEIG